MSACYIVADVDDKQSISNEDLWKPGWYRSVEKSLTTSRSDGAWSVTSVTDGKTERITTTSLSTAVAFIMVIHQQVVNKLNKILNAQKNHKGVKDHNFGDHCHNVTQCPLYKGNQFPLREILVTEWYANGNDFIALLLRVTCSSQNYSSTSAGCSSLAELTGADGCQSRKEMTSIRLVNRSSDRRVTTVTVACIAKKGKGFP